jgi:hypothetical protein
MCPQNRAYVHIPLLKVSIMCCKVNDILCVDDDDDVLLLPNSPSHDIWKRNLTILRKGQTIKLY